MEHVDFVVSNEIVAGIGIVVSHVMILEQVVGLQDSLKGVEVGAAAVAADDFEVLESNEIVESVEYQSEADQLDPDSVSVHNLTDPIPYDCSLDVDQTKNEHSDVALRSHRKAGERELAVVALGTFDVHFVDNVEIFFAGLVVDVETEE